MVMVSQMTLSMIDRFITHAQYIWIAFIVLDGIYYWKEGRGKGGRKGQGKNNLREDSRDSPAKQTYFLETERGLSSGPLHKGRWVI